MKKLLYFLLVLSGISGCTEKENQGYNCESGKCLAAFGNPKYLTLADCQSDCGTATGSTNTGGTTGTTPPASGPATGKFFVKIYYTPSGSCQATNVKHTLRMYWFCGNGKYSDTNMAGIWTNGEDAGGKFRTCLFGTETSICGTANGVTYNMVNRYYKIEYTVSPDKSSYSNTCVASGVSTIDFQGQTKNVVIKIN